MPNEAKRDPRIDPKPGDMLDNGHKRRTVQIRGDWRGWRNAVGGYEKFNSTNNGRVFTCYTIEGWKRWARKAKVIHAAD